MFVFVDVHMCCVSCVLLAVLELLLKDNKSLGSSTIGPMFCGGKTRPVKICSQWIERETALKIMLLK
jgi:hypothetical protein